MLKKLILLSTLLILSACNGVQKKNAAVQSADTPKPSALVRDRAEIFLKQLAGDTQLGFGKPDETIFSWKVAGESIGKVRDLQRTELPGFTVSLVRTPQLESKTKVPIVTVLSNYFVKEGFEKNIYNRNAGTVEGSDAFTKDGLNCLINWEIVGGIEGYKTEGVPMNVSVVCGG